MGGGLFDPLGTDRPPAPLPPRLGAPLALAGLAAAALAVLIALAYLRDDGDRGRAVAIVPIAHIAAPPKPPIAPPLAPPPTPNSAPQATAAAPPAPPPVRDDQEVEVQNGVRIIRPRRTGSAPGGQTLNVPGAVPLPAATGR